MGSFLPLRNGIFPSISVSKDVTVASNCNPSTWAIKQAWGNSGRKRRPVIYQPSDCSHSLWWALRIWKHRMLAPDSRGTYERNDFSESSLLHLPIHRKVLNFLTQDIRFLPLISICWCSNYLLLVAKLLYNPAPPSPPQTSSFRITWDATSWAWSPKIPT